MRKGLKIVGIITGIVSVITLAGLCCIYIKDIATNLVAIKKRIFSKN